MHIPGRVERKTLAERVEDHLMELITVNDLTPGAPLPSTAILAERFGVSRPVVREALSSLDARGIISIRNGKPAMVSPVTSTLLREYFGQAVRQQAEATVELLEVRRGIEVQGILLAATRRTEENLSALDNLLHDMGLALDDTDHFAELDTRLHLEIVAASQNRMLFHLSESIRDLMKSTIQVGLKSRMPGRGIEHTHLSHQEIVDALRRSESEFAADLMAKHLDNAAAKIMRSRDRDRELNRGYRH